MKTLNIPFTDAEYKKLKKAKEKMDKKHKTNYSWHKFFMLITKGVSAWRNGNK